MEQNAKRKLFQGLFIFLIISVIVFMIWMFFWIKGMSGQCVADPLEFYAAHNSAEENCDLDYSHYEITCVLNELNMDQFNFSIEP